MYSEKLRNNKTISSNGCCYVGVDVDKKSVIDRIEQFCKRDDIIGVPVKVVSDLFDEFCEENNFEKISDIIFGKIIREHFNLTRKSVRSGKKTFWVYTDAKVSKNHFNIDAVEVVRCKDCKHRGNDDICPMIKTRMCNDGDGYFDEVSEDKTIDDGFCSYGERKAEQI